MKSIAILTALLAFTATARASVTETYKQTYPLAPDGTVLLENVNGDIEITAWDKPEVSLVAEKRAKDDDELRRLEIVVDAQPARLAIKTKSPKTGGWSFFGDWGNNSSVRYKLTVPAGVRLEKVGTVNSDITVTGVRGAVKLETVNGSVAATGLAGDARLESVNGSLRAGFVSLAQVHEVTLKSVNGRAEVTLPPGANAHVKTGSVNGSAHVDQPIKLSQSGSHHLSGDLGDGSGPRIEIETVNGSIAVKEQ